MMNLPCLYIYMNLCPNQTKLTTILLAVPLPRVLGECEDAGQIVGALECVLLYFRRCSLLFQNVFSYILEGVLFFFRRCCRTPSSGAGGVWGCRRGCSCSPTPSPLKSIQPRGSPAHRTRVKRDLLQGQKRPNTVSYETNLVKALRIALADNVEGEESKTTPITVS